MKGKDIVNCQYLPLRLLKKVLDFIDSSQAGSRDGRCKRNLVQLQKIRCKNEVDSKNKTWRAAFYMALRRAIYSHDWNRLAYLLKKSPPWEHHLTRRDELAIYIKALTILLMNHPEAKAQSLLNDFLHMVLACRTVESKKAIYKCLLTLPEQIYGRRHKATYS